MDGVVSLQQENALLREQLRQEKALSLQRIEQRDRRIAALEQQIQQFLQRRFGASSEKVSPDQLGLFNEAEALLEVEPSEETIPVKPHSRRSKPRVSIPEDYPCEEIIHDLAEGDKVCPHDGTVLKVIGSEDHKQLDIVPAQLKGVVHRCLKYACPCCHRHVVTAKKPKQPIEKSIASASLLAYVAVQKYADALPLYRQSTIFQRLGIGLDRTNLAHWMIRCGELVQPLINLLLDQVQQRPVVHMDETTLQVLDEPGKAPQSTSYLWLVASFESHPAIVFHYAPSRGRAVPLALLADTVGALMVDGYEGYGPACQTHSIARLGCWAHARRKFVEAKKHQPQGKSGKADQALAWIQKLYQIERQSKDQPPQRRFEVRQARARPVLDQLKKWMDKSLRQVPPQSAMGKALGYLQAQWPRLMGYLEDGRYPIDNNRAENAIRPFVVGRRNWLFAKSQAGAKASAHLYSLIETAKANGLNPYDYLKTVFQDLPNAQTVEDIEALLPWNIKPG